MTQVWGPMNPQCFARDPVLELAGQLFIEPQHVVGGLVDPDAPLGAPRRVDAHAVAFPFRVDRSGRARLVVEHHGPAILQAPDAVPREGVFVAMVRKQERERLEGAGFGVEATRLVVRPRRASVDLAQLPDHPRLERKVVLREGVPVDPQLELEHLPEPVGGQVVTQRLDRHPLHADDALRAAVVVLHTVADASEDHDEVAGRLGQDPGSEHCDDAAGQDGLHQSITRLPDYPITRLVGRARLYQRREQFRAVRALRAGPLPRRFERARDESGGVGDGEADAVDVALARHPGMPRGYGEVESIGRSSTNSMP
jgi:hypothetical protein